MKNSFNSRSFPPLLPFFSCLIDLSTSSGVMATLSSSNTQQQGPVWATYNCAWYLMTTWTLHMYSSASCSLTVFNFWARFTFLMSEPYTSPTTSPHPPTAADVATATQAASPAYCITDCKHDNSNVGDMIRCCLCYQWCHEDCVNFDSKYDTSAWWLCHNCRGTNKRIATLEQTVSTLSNTVEQLATVNAQLPRTNEQLISEIRKLSTNQEARFDSLNRNLCDCKSSTSDSNSNKPDLLIGSSILRDLVSNDLKTLVIKSHGGSKTYDILKILNKMKNNEFGDIIIQIGSNDCATKKPVQEIIENFDKIIEAAKQVSSTGHVTLCGICPRTTMVMRPPEARRLTRAYSSWPRHTAVFMSTTVGPSSSGMGRWTQLVSY